MSKTVPFAAGSVAARRGERALGFVFERRDELRCWELAGERDPMSGPQRQELVATCLRRGASQWPGERVHDGIRRQLCAGELVAHPVAKSTRGSARERLRQRRVALLRGRDRL